MDLDADMYKGGNIDFSKMYPMEMYVPGAVNDPTDPLYKGGKLDIHKAFGKLPKLTRLDAWKIQIYGSIQSTGQTVSI